jgi:hypothetical protein
MEGSNSRNPRGLARAGGGNRGGLFSVGFKECSFVGLRHVLTNRKLAHLREAPDM